jgi:dihydroxyacetone kinase
MKRFMKRFINRPDTVVTEALDGLVALAGGELSRLDGFPHVKVVTRARLDQTKVALISGGGSGHEPAHAGFVGSGMLSAAVCGEIFASPSVEAIHAAIAATCGEAGCLLIVKNYTGDRLNFGLAAERARDSGLRVETVLVADDVAIPGGPQPRGVAGTLFVHKIAGHFAERGLTLDEIAALARSAAGETRSLGVSLESCTIPGRASSERLADDEGELGLGIHGEPGVETIALQSVRAIVELMAERLDEALAGEDRPCAALINNLGAVPCVEMSVIAHELLRSRLAPRIELVVGPAPLMTSLDMNGFSLSLLPLDDDRREALLSPCAPAAWPAPTRPAPVEARPLPATLDRGESPPPSSQPERERALAAVLDALFAARAELDALDAKVGDGDTGSTVAKGAAALRERLAELPFADARALLRAISDQLAITMGGSLGVLTSILCRALGRALDADAGNWPEAFAAAVARVREVGGAAPGDRSMIDALNPAAETLLETGDLEQAAGAARVGAESTAAMTRAKAGRAAYLSAASLRGVTDPGAVAVALAFEALRDACP